MSHQTKLYGIRKLASQIDAELTQLLGGVPSKHSYSYEALGMKIFQWEQTFLAIQKTLKSQSHFNHMMHQRQRFSPGSFSAGQRFRSREANVRELSDSLSDVEEKLRDLVRALLDGKGAAANSLDAIGHVMGNWLNSAKHSNEGIMGSAPNQLQKTVAEIHAHAPSGPGTPPPMPVIDIFTLILAYFTLLKSISKK